MGTADLYEYCSYTWKLHPTLGITLQNYIVLQQTKFKIPNYLENNNKKSVTSEESSRASSRDRFLGRTGCLEREY